MSTADAFAVSADMLRADEAVAYGRVVEVMGVAQKAGLNRIGFVADAKAAEEKKPADPKVN